LREGRVHPVDPMRSKTGHARQGKLAILQGRV
jgi:hypothetical protein